ncbi:ABC transporter substrate-binding protein [Marinibaculum pumilum]|uniref:ABC transporter substrate-binding protein n=1 Tax=Marinibaculum pumilum TaxID=1766165 RepID=A0ABV7KX69_9PROT
MGYRPATRRGAWAIAAGFVLGGLLLAGQPLASGSAAAADPIKIGTVFNTTGGQAILDVPASHGAQLAIGQINAAGGVEGRPLQWVAVDGNSVPLDLAAQTGQALNDDPGIVAFLGLSDTDNVLAAAPVAAAASRVFLTSGATSPLLPGQVPTWLFLACFGDNVQAAAGAEWAYRHLKARRVAIFYEPTESYTKLLQRYFGERFTALGGRIVATKKVYPGAAIPHLPRTDMLASGDVDLLFLSVQTAEDAVRLVPLIRRAGYRGPILGGDGYDAEAVWAKHPDIGDTYFTTHVYLAPDNPNPKVGAFLKAYAAARPGEDPGAFGALGFDAAGLVAAAMTRAGATDPGGVLEGLTGLEGYQGVTGTISFPGESRIPLKSVTILKVDKGRQAFVDQILPESVPKP